MISNSTGNKKETGTGKTGYSPKTGVFQATVAAINPTEAQVRTLLGKSDISWKAEYLGKTNEGEDRVNIEIWLKELNTGEFYRLRFMMVDKLRQSKNNPGSYQFINEWAESRWGQNKADVTERFTEFASKNPHQALVGEENLTDFLFTWLVQGKKPNETVKISPDLKAIFRGDFTELQQVVLNNASEQVMAIATVSETNGKQYQNTYNRIAPGWYFQKIIDGDRTGKIGKYIEVATGAYGIKDQYSLNPLGQSASTGTASGMPFIAGGAEYQARSNDLPF